MSDCAAELVETVREAATRSSPLQIAGGGTKAFFGRAIEAAPVDVTGHKGILNYSPAELVLTARGGTPLTEIKAALDEHNQELAFEPPEWGENATLAGSLACNVAGPARPWRGSMRDAVLGVGLINGRGEHLRFGGQVMKNVAGFDVSRLQAGALGAFGIITHISLKVLPKLAHSITITQEVPAASAVKALTDYAAQPKPLSAAAWIGGRLYLRVSGARSAVAATARQWGGEPLDGAANFWRDLAKRRLPFFSGATSLWRFSLRASAPLALPESDWLLDWAGAQRFLAADHDPEQLQRLAREADGHVSAIGGHAPDRHEFSPPRHIRELHLRLKAAFDPQGIFNPGMLYSWL